MNRRITGFQQDAELQWVALLECGHRQHLRHDPPWQYRPWVMEEGSRLERLGSFLNCTECDDPRAQHSGTVPEAEAGSPGPYEDARLQGLCHDGAAELTRRPAPRRRSDPTGE